MTWQGRGLGWAGGDCVCFFFFVGSMVGKHMCVLFGGHDLLSIFCGLVEGAGLGVG